MEETPRDWDREGSAGWMRVEGKKKEGGGDQSSSQPKERSRRL